MWAAQYPAYKIASDQMSSANLNFWTFVFAILLLAPFLLREHLRHPKRWGIKAPMVKEFLILGLVGNVPPSIFIAWGIAHSTASNAAIISLTIPVLMVLMAVLMLGEHMTLLRWFSIIMAVLGTVMVSRLKSAESFFSPSALAGNAVIFLAGAGSAFYNTYSKKLLSKFTELEVLVYSFSVTCMACAALSLVGKGYPFYVISRYDWRAWVAVFVLGAFSWGIAMILWMWVLKRLEIAQVSSSIYLLSFFGVLLSAITLRERLTLPQIAGGMLVLTATFLTSEYEVRLAQSAQTKLKFLRNRH
jgi:drug/metabolite transporter (DMT)-like permease